MYIETRRAIACSLAPGRHKDDGRKSSVFRDLIYLFVQKKFEIPCDTLDLHTVLVQTAFGELFRLSRGKKKFLLVIFIVSKIRLKSHANLLRICDEDKVIIFYSIISTFSTFLCK